MSRYILLAMAALLVACSAPVPAAPTTAPVAPPTSVPASSPVARKSASPSPASSAPAATERYATIRAADSAFARKDFTTALTLYRRAADDDSLVDTPSTGQRQRDGSALRAYARFRIVVADAIVGQEDDAHRTVELLRQVTPPSPYFALAQVFWHTYGVTGDLHAACDQVTRAVQEEPRRFLEPLNGWSSADPERKPGDLCTLP